MQKSQGKSTEKMHIFFYVSKALIFLRFKIKDNKVLLQINLNKKIPNLTLEKLLLRLDLIVDFRGAQFHGESNLLDVVNFSDKLIYYAAIPLALVYYGNCFQRSKMRKKVNSLMDLLRKLLKGNVILQN